MDAIHAKQSASITELKKNPSALIGKSGGDPVIILNHNKPAAYLVPAKTYEMIMEKIDDYELARIIKEREPEKELAVKVDLDDL
jgi:antitoxin StbD